MREIEFRGKPIEYKKNWIYGNGFVIDNATVGFPVYVWENVPYSNWFKVHPETVGQYTGIKDKKGVKIFEGDIVKYFSCRGPLLVRFWLGGFYIGKDTIISMADSVEVIGNIHDNPELLEEGE